MKLIFVFLGILMSSALAQAQSETNCGEQLTDGQRTYNRRLKTMAEDMGLQLRVYLGENADNAALVSRAGADFSTRKFQSPSNQKYSHTGIAIKDSKTGQWKFVHLLNDCAGPSSSLHQQGLAEFFMDDPFMLDVRVLVPSIELQHKIVQAIEDRANGGRGLAHVLHNPSYSNIANPFALEYQNSNMWVMAIVASAQSGATSLAAAQSYYERKGFQPSQVEISSLEAFLGPIFTKNAKTDDHSDEESSSGWYNFAASAGVNKYLRATDQLVADKELCYKSGCDTVVRGNLIPDTP